jgi:enoyl-CoA hydratase
MADEEEILFEVRGRAGIATLNRPKALNALTYHMVHRLQGELCRWAGDDRVERVVIRAVPGRAFSAGGDIRAIHDWGRAGDPMLHRFYFDEYRLNRFIKRFPKPYVALVDGIVMGGGVGVSVHGSHRIAGENYLFAMPETGIGFFPDVGATWFLPRCPGETGLYLGLTGARLRAADALAAGIATHFAPPDRWDRLTDDLASTGDLDGLLGSLTARPEAASALSAIAGEIDDGFSGRSVDDVIGRLEASASDFAVSTAATLAAKSPLSQKVTFRQLREGRRLDFEDCMRLEARLVTRFGEGHDLYEGIRAVVIDKDNRPDWQPKRLQDVTDAMVDAYFAPLEEELEFPA